ncbi:MAG: hypothetical protein ABIK68_03175, partial [bacterium]
GLHLTLLGVFLASSWKLVDKADKTNQLADRNRDLQELQRPAEQDRQLFRFLHGCSGSVDNDGHFQPG